jgi:hypothetical protein
VKSPGSVKTTLPGRTTLMKLKLNPLLNQGSKMNMSFETEIENLNWCLNRLKAKLQHQQTAALIAANDVKLVELAVLRLFF